MMAGVFVFAGISFGAVTVHRRPVGKLAVPNASQLVPDKVYVHGEPTDQEQMMLELVNRARSDPPAECGRMIASDDEHIQQALATFNVDIVQLQADFAGYVRQPPLAFNPQLITSARLHSVDMAANDFQEHIGSDGSTLAVRLTRAGYDYTLGGENVFAYAFSLWYAQGAFLIDWGVPDLGHRKNQLNLEPAKTAFREIGIGVIPENSPTTTVGPLVITQDFGLSNDAVVFITGVVYRDVNANGSYDEGEGINNVAILPDHGEYSAVSSTSGGYAIPVAQNSGQYVLKAVRVDQPEYQATAWVEGENVKVDFQLGDPEYASVQGTVEDEQTDQPTAGVTVRLMPANLSVVTDETGMFLFTGLAPAAYSLEAELTGRLIEPNPVALTLSAGQVYRARLTVKSQITPTLTMTPTPTLAPSPGGPDPGSVTPAETGCSALGLSLVILIVAGLGGLTRFRRDPL